MAASAESAERAMLPRFSGTKEEIANLTAFPQFIFKFKIFCLSNYTDKASVVFDLTKHEREIDKPTNGKVFALFVYTTMGKANEIVQGVEIMSGRQAYEALMRKYHVTSVEDQSICVSKVLTLNIVFTDVSQFVYDFKSAMRSMQMSGVCATGVDPAHFFMGVPLLLVKTLILNNLPRSFDLFVKESTLGNPTIPELFDSLESFGKIAHHRELVSGAAEASAFSMRVPGPPRGNPKDTRPPKGGAVVNADDKKCQHKGHTADTCFILQPEKKELILEQKKVLAEAKQAQKDSKNNQQKKPGVRANAALDDAKEFGVRDIFNVHAVVFETPTAPSSPLLSRFLSPALSGSSVSAAQAAAGQPRLRLVASEGTPYTGDADVLINMFSVTTAQEKATDDLHETLLELERNVIQQQRDAAVNTLFSDADEGAVGHVPRSTIDASVPVGTTEITERAQQTSALAKRRQGNMMDRYDGPSLEEQTDMLAQQETRDFKTPSLHLRRTRPTTRASYQREITDQSEDDDFKRALIASVAEELHLDTTDADLQRAIDASMNDAGASSLLQRGLAMIGVAPAIDEVAEMSSIKVTPFLQPNGGQDAPPSPIPHLEAASDSDSDRSLPPPLFWIPRMTKMRVWATYENAKLVKRW